ncbi:hypothetical protein ZIOFF_058820 [Zingiber officinale]|uniref:Uncharacterized protein n=1 Tax=Zingiber officinale TaxID=94328 RepID=A0A8J5F8H5_ZINOF|nr:hypothetical protein ZIOFF_058820 [Zingiber officinale]
MSSSTEEGAPIINEGRFLTILVCWLLGNGCLFSMNSLLTIEDYFPFYLSTIVGCCNFWKRWHWSIFIGVCFVSGAFGIADAHVQGGMVGDLSLMSQELIQVRYQCQSNSLKISESNQTRSFLVNAESLAGLAASGALTSALRLITKAAFENSQNGFREQVLMFFSISCFFELVCILLYAFVFPKVPIVKYYREKAASEGSMTVSADLAAGGMHKHQVQEIRFRHKVEDPKLIERLSNKQLLLENIDYAIDLFLIYVLTLSIFPGFLSEDTDSHSLGSWYALVLIAMYNVWDLIGRYIPLLKPLVLSSRKETKWNLYAQGPQQNALENLLVVCLFASIFAGVMLDWLRLIGKGW